MNHTGLNYSMNKGIMTRGEIVELCRTPKSLARLSEHLGITRDRVSKHCRRLVDEGYLSKTTEPGWGNSYLTIVADKYPEPDVEVVYKPRPKEETIPGARVFRMEYFDKIPGYFNNELKPQEFRGIGSGLSMMEWF